MIRMHHRTGAINAFSPKLMRLLALFSFISLTGAATAASATSATSTAMKHSASELPSPVYLWDEQPRVSPDREYLKDQRIHAVDNPAFLPFLPEASRANGAAVVIFPGGGYVRLAIAHEGYAVARWFAARGVAAFVVKYRMQEYGFPAPLLDAQRAVRLVKSRAQQFNVDPEKVGVVGFSAGGHLAANVTTDYDFAGTASDPLAGVSARPAFAVLGYPVITMGQANTHAGSQRALLGESPRAENVAATSLEKRVTASVPPVFVFHGIGDQSVPVSNSLVFFDAVAQVNKASELHIYQTSIHGVGMIAGQGSVSLWPEALSAWLQGIGILPAGH